jgi:hypothetical protein
MFGFWAAEEFEEPARASLGSGAGSGGWPGMEIAIAA